MKFSRLILLLLVTLLLTAAAGAALAAGGRDRYVGELAVLPAPPHMVIDGKTDAWDLTGGMLLKGGSGKLLGQYYAWLNLQYDADALYVLVRWHDAAPMANTANPERGQAGRDGGDCLELRLLTDRLVSLQGWYSRPLQAPAVRLAYGPDGDQQVRLGRQVAGIEQAFQENADGQGYTQELRLPWKILTASGQPVGEDQLLRLGVDLWWQGLDPETGYRAWGQISSGTMNEQLDGRWGALMGWGIADGVREGEQLLVHQNPVGNGAVGVLEPHGHLPDQPSAYALRNGEEVTRNTRLSIVPAPGPVKIDGDLTDWDLSGGTEIGYEPVLLRNRYATRLHMMYDAQGLYVGLQWRGATPMYNVNRPDRFAWGYDGGDALQLRLATDLSTTIEAWYCTPLKQAALKRAVWTPDSSGGYWNYSSADLQTQGAQEAFQPVPGGYVQEIFLPWPLITQDGRPRQAGDQLRWECDTFWSGLEGNRLPFVVNARLQPRTEVVSLPGHAERQEFLTAVINGPDGTRVRNLYACSARAAGEALGGWDGRDDQGKIVPAGTYRYQLLSHTGIGWQYRMTFEGPGHPPWANEDGTGSWGAENGPPESVVVAGDQVFLGWPDTEKGDTMIATDLHGQRQWGVLTALTISHVGSVALAADDKYVYYAGDKVDQGPQRLGEQVVSYVVCYDKRTGMRRGFSLLKAAVELVRWPRAQAKHAWWWDEEKEGFTPEAWGMHPEMTHDPFLGCGANIMGAAIRQGRLYLSYYQFNKVVALDAATAQVVQEYPVERPCGLTVDPAGRLLVISGRQVLALDTASGQTTPVVTAGLEAPVGVTTDAQDNIYVSDWGHAMCVRVFGGDGRLLRTIGKVGGRPDEGKFDPAGMLLPRGLAVDSNGHLWVMEDDGAPRRISVWDARTGALVKEFLGGTRSGEAAATVIVPWDKNQALSYQCEYNLDWAHGTYNCASTLWRRESFNARFAIAATLGGGLNQVRLIRLGGRVFAVGSIPNEAVICEYKDGRYLPLSAVGSYHGGPKFMEPTEDLWGAGFDSWGPTAYPEAFRGQKNNTNFAWCDRDGNGQVDPGEVVFTDPALKQTPFSDYWGMGVGDDLSLYFHGWPDDIYRLRVLGWTPSGAPVYDSNRAELVVKHGPWGDTLTADHEGRIITAINAETRQWGVAHPTLAGYSAAGQLLWSYPITDGYGAGVVNGNTLLGPVKLGGGQGEMVGRAQYHGDRIPLITTDGLFIAGVLLSQREAVHPGPDVILQESTQEMCQTDDGKVYVLNGMNEHNVLELTGLDTLRRGEGTLELTPAQVARAEVISQRQQQAGVAARPTELAVPALTASVVVDGNLEKWAAAPAQAIGSASARTHARAWLAHDQANLYLACAVTKLGGFANSGVDPQRLFLSGDAVELDLGTNLNARKNAATGDLRVVFSETQGQPVATLYKPYVGGTIPGNAVNFSSGNGVVLFSSVTPLAGAQVVIRNTADGYALEAAVPLAALGLTGAPGSRALGDIGVVFADATGRDRADRQHLFSPDAFYPDAPAEARLTPDKWGSLIFR